MITKRFPSIPAEDQTWEDAKTEILKFVRSGGIIRYTRPKYYTYDSSGKTKTKLIESKFAIELLLSGTLQLCLYKPELVEGSGLRLT